MRESLENNTTKRRISKILRSSALFHDKRTGDFVWCSWNYCTVLELMRISYFTSCKLRCKRVTRNLRQWNYFNSVVHLRFSTLRCSYIIKTLHETAGRNTFLVIRNAFNPILTQILYDIKHFTINSCKRTWRNVHTCSVFIKFLYIAHSIC